MNRREWCKGLAALPAAWALTKTLPAAAEKGESMGVSRRGKILMPIGDATEVVDTLYPYFRLQEEGYDVVVAGPEARLYHLVTHEIPPDSPVPWDITREGPGYHLKADIAFRDVKPAEYAGLFLSGGRAPEYLRYDKDLLRAVRHFFEADKPVASVCHGVELIAAAGVVNGRKMTTVPKCALDITQCGGEYIDQPCVIDGHLVSCQTWHDYNTLFMKTFIGWLNNRKG